MKQKPPGGRDAQLVVEFSVFQGVADLHEFFLEGRVTNNLVKRAHKKHPFFLAVAKEYHALCPFFAPLPLVEWGRWNYTYY